jgi:hypothetical protein
LVVGSIPVSRSSNLRRYAGVSEREPAGEIPSAFCQGSE